VRLKDNPDFVLPIDSETEIYVWNIVKQLEDVTFYELPSERPPLVVFNRYDHVDPELGTILEPVCKLSHQVSFITIECHFESVY